MTSATVSAFIRRVMLGHSGFSGRVAGSLACRPSVVSAAASVVVPSTSVSLPAGQCAYFEWDIRRAASIAFIGGFAALGAGSERQQRSGVAHCTAAEAPPAGAAGDVTQQATKTTIVFVLGGPGSGKGTQCSKLITEFDDIAHFSAGDLLRAHVKSGTEDGNKVAKMMQEGQIVPSSVTVGLLKEAMRSSEKSKFLIDGFPRNVENREAFEKVMGRDCDFIVFFDCPEEVMEQRLLGRNEGRADDNIETIRKRFKVFVDSSIPVVQHYEAKGKAYKFQATNAPELIYNDVRRLFM